MDEKYRMRIEVPIGRISISKAALHAMKDPEFIELAIEPKSLALRILRAPYGLRVKLTSSGEFYIKSVELMKGLCSLIPYLNEPCSYRLLGEVFGDGMRFSMDTLEKIERNQNKMLQADPSSSEVPADTPQDERMLHENIEH